MTLAILAGIASGIIAFIPLFLALRLLRPNDSFMGNSMFTMMILIVFSFVILAFALFIVYKISVTFTLAFGVAEAGAFLCTTVIYIVCTNRTKS